MSPETLASTFRLRPSPKFGDGGLHRTISPEVTLERMQPLLKTVGITRLADITGLDRIGIPTYSAIVPDSADVLSVYNGKGPTPMHAKVGAIMEAVERFSALRFDRPIRVGAYTDLAREQATLDPESLVLGMFDEYGADKPVGWVEGWDLMAEEPVLVPVQAVAILYEERYGHPCYRYSSTNGLASGNTLEEAICHGLCELIERDAWTLADLRARHIPAARWRKRQRTDPDGTPSEPRDDVDLYPDLDLSHAGPVVSGLLERFADAGVELRVKDITSDLGIATVYAVTVEQGPDRPLAHFGVGTHPDAEIAVTRALTEVAQCRAVDIQAVREDIQHADAEDHPYAAHTRRTSRLTNGRWFYESSSTRRPYRELPSVTHHDILDDIRLMLDVLRGDEIERAIVVDLTHPELGVPVARVLVPGLESFAADQGRFGRRAGRYARIRQ